MVHALQEIHRVLVDAGHLIDMRPLSGNWPLDIVAGEQVTAIGPVDDSQGVMVDATASSAIASAVQKGRFALEHTEFFDIYYYWDTLADMQHYAEEHWKPEIILPVPLLEQARQTLSQQPQSVLRIRLNMLLSIYRKT